MSRQLPRKADFYGSSLTSLRLLVVDDDPTIRDCSVAAFSASNVFVDVASDGKNAFALLAARSYDAILVDLRMPEVDGLSFLKGLRRDSRWEHMPAVVITSRNDLFAIDQAYEIGATAFTVKPVNWSLLAYELRYLLRMSRVEADLRTANRQSQDVNDVQRNILQVMRHETHTPMNAILGFSRLLNEEISGPLGHPDYRQFAGIILESAERLQRTLDDLQMLARLQAPTFDLNLDECFLPTVLARALEKATVEIGETHGTVAISPSISEAPRLTCDFGLLARGLQALIKNALTHGASDRPCTIAFEPAASGIGRIIVRDFGKGIEPGAIPRMMQPFQQSADLLKRDREGLGVGLALANHIFSSHGGSLVLENVPGGGIRATIELPVEVAAASVPRSAAG